MMNGNKNELTFSRGVHHNNIVLLEVLLKYLVLLGICFFVFCFSLKHFKNEETNQKLLPVFSKSACICGILKKKNVCFHVIHSLPTEIGDRILLPMQ